MNYFLIFRVAKYEGEIAQHDHDITQKVRSISINDNYVNILYTDF